MVQLSCSTMYKYFMCLFFSARTERKEVRVISWGEKKRKRKDLYQKKDNTRIIHTHTWILDFVRFLMRYIHLYFFSGGGHTHHTWVNKSKKVMPNMETRVKSSTATEKNNYFSEKSPEK